MNCWHTFLSRSFISAVLIPFILNPSLVAAAASDATDASLVPIHDTQTGSLVGYVDIQQQEVFNSQHKYVGAGTTRELTTPAEIRFWTNRCPECC